MQENASELGVTKDDCAARNVRAITGVICGAVAWELG